MSPALVIIPLILAGLMLAPSLSGSRAASAGDVTHPSVVGEVPRVDTPKVLEGYVYASVQLGDRVIVGGAFTQVERSDGTIAARNNLMAYDINTGALIEDFAPVVNNDVLALKADPDAGVFYAGGKFSSVDGIAKYRVAKFGYFGDVNPSFGAVVSAKVFAIEIADGMVFIGGAFETINGERHARIAALDEATGNLVPGFQIQAEGIAGKAGANSVKALDLHPDGERLLVVHNAFELVDANGPKAHLNAGATIIDITNFTVTDWNTRWFELNRPRCSQGAMQNRDGEFSPDGSMFVIVEKGNYLCDKVVAFDTAIDPDPEGNPAKWVTAAHDSVFSVGITDQAVYVGGHFCFVRDFGTMTAAQGAAFPWENKPEACQTGGNETIGEFDARYQIAALDPDTGEALDWDPRSNAQEAVYDIEPIVRGLLIGQDRDRLNQRRTGLHAFIDFGGVTPPFNPPGEIEPDCMATLNPDGSIQLNWTTLPATTYQSVIRDGGWLATYDAATNSHLDPNPGAGAHSYTLRVKVAGLPVADYACTPDPVIVNPGAGPECAATVNADGSVQLSWSTLAATSYQSVIRDGGWLATYDDQSNSHLDAAPGVGSHTYVLRVKVMGQPLADYTCTPDPVVIGPGVGPTCTVTQAGADVSIVWDAVPGNVDYQVRRDGAWIAGTTATNFIDAGRTATDHSWVIRYWSGGANDITCSVI